MNNCNKRLYTLCIVKWIVADDSGNFVTNVEMWVIDDEFTLGS